MSDSLARVVTKYLETTKFIGVCGYKIVTDNKGGGLPKITVKINVDFIYGSHTNELFLIKRIIGGVRNQLEKVFDLEFPIDYALHEC